MPQIQRKIENINTQMDDVRDFLKIAEKKLIEIDSGDNKAGQEGFRFQKLQNATYGEEVWPILLVIPWNRRPAGKPNRVWPGLFSRTGR